MIVVTRHAPRPSYNVAGIDALGQARSPTMIYPPNQARVRAAQAAAGSWVQVQPVHGLGSPGLGSPGLGQGFLDDIPAWVPWGVGGLVAGAAVGWFIFKRKKRRK